MTPPTKAKHAGHFLLHGGQGWERGSSSSGLRHAELYTPGGRHGGLAGAVSWASSELKGQSGWKPRFLCLFLSSN